MIQEFIAIAARRHDLTQEQAQEAMQIVMSGEATPCQIAGFLVALHMKGETVDEITGFARAMRAMATHVPATRRSLIDTCGTGGDRSGTFNVSTTAAFVVAGAGVAVAKHGNRSATSKCGSADVLEALGVNIEASAERVGQCVDEVGIGFLFARTLHSAMKYVAPARTELRIRTVFNILGPLTNPANACGQVMGVFDRSLVVPLAQVLSNLGTRHAFVVAGSDGLDELTLGGPSVVAEAADGTVRSYGVSPGDFGLAEVPSDLIKGGDPEANATILREVLSGKKGPHRDIVLLNAAPALVAGKAARDWQAGVELAAKSIDSGAAMRTLEALVRVSHDS